MKADQRLTNGTATGNHYQSPDRPAATSPELARTAAERRELTRPGPRLTIERLKS